MPDPHEVPGEADMPSRFEGSEDELIVWAESRPEMQVHPLDRLRYWQLVAERRVPPSGRVKFGRGLPETPRRVPIKPIPAWFAAIPVIVDEREQPRRVAPRPRPRSIRRMPVSRTRGSHRRQPRTRRARLVCRSGSSRSDADAGEGPAPPSGPSLFDLFAEITPGLSGPERMALFWSLPPRLRDGMWGDLRSRSGWSR